MNRIFILLTYLFHNVFVLALIHNIFNFLLFYSWRALHCLWKKSWKKNFVFFLPKTSPSLSVHNNVSPISPAILAGLLVTYIWNVLLFYCVPELNFKEEFISVKSGWAARLERSIYVYIDLSLSRIWHIKIKTINKEDIEKILPFQLITNFWITLKFSVIH